MGLMDTQSNGRLPIARGSSQNEVRSEQLNGAFARMKAQAARDKVATEQEATGAGREPAGKAAANSGTAQDPVGLQDRFEKAVPAAQAKAKKFNGTP